MVVGSRASQRSANRRKREARTATDSLVADDIGSFPDRNVNEAISRIPGVALGRNDFGEGESIAIRGNGPDLTRVELDGIGVQGTSGLDASRGADLRELPAELIESVDVVKGATADMTEGSLGGTVQIKTRSALSLSRPFASIRLGGQQNSLGREWTPEVNAIAGRKFFDGRVGVLLNANYRDIQNDGHSYELTTSGNRNYSRLFDFDNSPEKTFVYNLATLDGDGADSPFANSLETPRTLLTKSIAAATKADCLSAFPNNPTGTANQRGQRILEQQSCLNQWNDYTPSLIRNITKTQREQRSSFDARLDFRVTDRFSVFIKGTTADRSVADTFRVRNSATLFAQNVAGTFVDSVTGTPRQRTLAPNAPPGYFRYDGLFNVGNNPSNGVILNVDPNSIKVDSKHNVTEMRLTNNSLGLEQIENQIDVRTRFVQTGGTFKGELVTIEGMAGMTNATSERGDKRTGRSFVYGDSTIRLQSNGLWDVELPNGIDDADPGNYLQLNTPRCVVATAAPPNCIGQNAVTASPTSQASPAYTVGQMPLVTNSFSIMYSPARTESSERIAKLDLTYRTEEVIPFITRFKTGVLARKNMIDFWGNGGYVVTPASGTFGTPGYVPAVVVPGALVRGSYRGCQPTAGSSGPGGLSCNYGFVPSSDPASVRSGVETLTLDQLRTLFTSSIEKPGFKYFGDLPNRGNLPDAWSGIRTDVLFNGLESNKFINTDCLKRCTASDGKEYDQPVFQTDETIMNMYAMFDFSAKLPFGMVFDGNYGVRGSYRKIRATGLQTLTSIRTTASFDPLNPSLASGITTVSVQQNTTLNATDFNALPTLNLNLWGLDRSVVLRGFAGKTVALPPPRNLMAAGNCIIDERVSVVNEADGGNEDDVFGCTGRVGNPALKPFTAWNYNISLEWYPNADTLLSATYGILDVTRGGPIGITRVLRPFEGSSALNPATGERLSDLTFNVPTFTNGPGFKRTIYEFQAKTALTFLPWRLRYTGFDANISVLGSAAVAGLREPLSGDLTSPPNESRYFLNGSFWYDDRKLSMRVSYQRRTAVFNCITPCGGNTGDINYPGQNWSNVRLVSPGYNPGVARYTDATAFIDAKIAYNINSQFQIFAEGRNMTRQALTASTGEYIRFADDTPRLMRIGYGGRRIILGARAQFGGNRRR